MVNFNGNIVSTQEYLISINNRGLNYGDALFETIKVVSDKILFWEDHYFRLMASMRILRMEIPMNFTMEFLENEIKKTINSFKNPSEAYRVKILINRKEGGKYTPITNGIDYFIIVESLDTPFYVFKEETYQIGLFKDYYIQSNLLSTLKTTSKITNVLGSIFAKENGFQNCILLNDQKQVVEALNGNIFMVNGDTIVTAPLTDGCLKGIIRKQIISICNQSKELTLIEKSISPFDLQKADELFITNVIVGIQSVTNFRKKQYETKVAKEILQKLNVMARLS